MEELTRAFQGGGGTECARGGGRRCSHKKIPRERVSRPGRMRRVYADTLVHRERANTG
jgi:hypothetical protein